MTSTATEVLIFKTNLHCTYAVKNVAPLLDTDQRIIRWSVDCEDTDKVLRIVTNGLQVNDVITLLTNAGYHCEELPD
ncbi:hypothetical protein KTO58_26895 [Chitinophaga pendula]|uniref:hypothetical protein n=1 Tax=Chitinophaga TaxID=79328 RepID=UPI000BAE9057|nr:MULTISPECIES: hypothetical protein [Chitinophaga]ASZ14765.1 hypothetical protein CK934_01870 [Chitinophaga sp. MD30]UCJ07246.1 hypothetical protein KTO58_26895 [Chitinophaga pendula]